MWYFIVPTQPIQYTPPNAHQRQSSHPHFSPFYPYCVENRVSSSLKNSPQSACLNAAMPVGSKRLASWVLLAVTPKPSGVSFMLYTTIPWCSGQSSDHRPTCALRMWPLGLIQSLWRAWAARMGRAVMWRRNLRVLVNLPGGGVSWGFFAFV